MFDLNNFDTWTNEDIKKWKYSDGHTSNVCRVIDRLKSVKINIPKSKQKWQEHILKDLQDPCIIKQRSTGQCYYGSVKNGKFHGLGILCLGVSKDIVDDSCDIFINGVFVKGEKEIGDISKGSYKKINIMFARI